MRDVASCGGKPTALPCGITPGSLNTVRQNTTALDANIMSSNATSLGCSPRSAGASRVTNTSKPATSSPVTMMTLMRGRCT